MNKDVRVDAMARKEGVVEVGSKLIKKKGGGGGEREKEECRR